MKATKKSCALRNPLFSRSRLQHYYSKLAFTSRLYRDEKDRRLLWRSASSQALATDATDAFDIQDQGGQPADNPGLAAIPSGKNRFRNQTAPLAIASGLRPRATTVGIPRFAEN
jgi:hypothetical protein